MKFRVGEKVKVLKEGSHGQDIGSICKITKINKGNTDIPYLAKCPSGIEMWFYEKELGKIQFTKSDLKDGDIVTYRGGKRATALREQSELRSIDQIGLMYLKDYDERLKYSGITEDDRKYDIIKVERPVKYETVYERKEEILDEAEKRYLRDVIRPFRNKVKSISKNKRYYDESISYIYIELIEDDVCLPDFKGSTMYKNMELNKKYSLEELRAIKE